MGYFKNHLLFACNSGDNPDYCIDSVERAKIKREDLKEKLIIK
jgi:hypothetical protein